jgi:hypothetical protein
MEKKRDVPRITFIVLTTRRTHHTWKDSTLVGCISFDIIRCFASLVGNGIQIDLLQHVRFGLVVGIGIAHAHGQDGLILGGHVWMPIEPYNGFGRWSSQFEQQKVVNKLVVADPFE